MEKRFIPLIIGVVLALLASFMIGTYLNQREQAIMEKAKEAMAAFQRSQAGVFIARKDIPPNMPILPDMVDKVLAPRNQIHPRAIQFFSDIADKQSAAYIKAGSQLTYDLLRERVAVAEGEIGQFSLIIPEGKRAVTMQVENMAPLVGKVMPGDHVDVIGVIPSPEKRETVSVTLFQNVMVLAVGEEFMAKEGRPSVVERALAKGERRAVAPTTVTLALSPEETSILSYVQEHGKIKIVMRFPLDAGEKLLPVINASALYQFLSSRGFVAPVSGGAVVTMFGGEGPKPSGMIEIYRGGKKGE